MNKTIILATFISPDRLDWVVNYLDSDFKIKKDKIFCYRVINDETKLILTFKLVIEDGEHLNIKKLFPSAVTIHKRGTALYTINALNKLIELNNLESDGNIDHKSFIVNWDEYQNKLILLSRGELVIFDINRVF